MSEDSSANRTEEQDWRALGERLRESREFLGLSQQEVADLLGLSRPAVTHIEAGKRKVSTLELRELARLYRRPYEWLVDEMVGPAVDSDDVSQALFRASRGLSEHDRAQLLQFAQFLNEAGRPPEAPDE